jgi:DNA mismatch endonuclease (patch repair protein)
MDVFSKRKRSKIMSANKSKDTKPEKAVRSALHAKGYGFRLHRRDLPGTPDVVLNKYKVVIFIHGCFWHQHGCKASSRPHTNKAYWNKKFADNQAREKKNFAELRELGWKVVVVWECDINKNIRAVASGLDRMLKRRLKTINPKEANINAKEKKAGGTQKKHRNARRGKK